MLYKTNRFTGQIAVCFGLRGTIKKSAQHSEFYYHAESDGGQAELLLLVSALDKYRAMI